MTVGHSFASAASLTLLVLSLSAGAWLNARPKAPAGPVAALFPPWWRARDAFDGAAAAGAAIVRTGAWPTLLVVTSPDPRLEAHLRAAGALLLLDPRALGGCLAGA